MPSENGQEKLPLPRKAGIQDDMPVLLQAMEEKRAQQPDDLCRPYPEYGGFACRSGNGEPAWVIIDEVQDCDAMAACAGEKTA